MRQYGGGLYSDEVLQHLILLPLAIAMRSFKDCSWKALLCLGRFLMNLYPTSPAFLRTQPPLTTYSLILSVSEYTNHLPVTSFLHLECDPYNIPLSGYMIEGLCHHKLPEMGAYKHILNLYWKASFPQKNK